MLDEILPDLGKARSFSEADLKDGFLQIELDDESSRLTTFQTPWGRHRWLRMPSSSGVRARAQSPLRRVILWTDHKPLISINKKLLASAPKRLQRLLLRLQQYDVDLR